MHNELKILEIKNKIQDIRQSSSKQKLEEEHQKLIYRKEIRKLEGEEREEEILKKMDSTIELDNSRVSKTGSM